MLRKMDDAIQGWVDAVSGWITDWIGMRRSTQVKIVSMIWTAFAGWRAYSENSKFYFFLVFLLSACYFFSPIQRSSPIIPRHVFYLPLFVVNCFLDIATAMRGDTNSFMLHMTDATLFILLQYLSTHENKERKDSKLKMAMKDLIAMFGTSWIPEV